MNAVEQLGCNSDLSIHLFFKMFGISQLNQTKNRKIRLVAIFVHICHIGTFRPFFLSISHLHQTLIQRSGGSPRIHHLRGKVPKNSFWGTFLLPQKAISNRPSKMPPPSRNTDTFHDHETSNYSNPSGCQTGSEELRLWSLAPKKWQRRIQILLMIGKLGV